MQVLPQQFRSFHPYGSSFSAVSNIQAPNYLNAPLTPPKYFPQNCYSHSHSTPSTHSRGFTPQEESHVLSQLRNFLNKAVQNDKLRKLPLTTEEIETLERAFVAGVWYQLKNEKNITSSQTLNNEILAPLSIAQKYSACLASFIEAKKQQEIEHKRQRLQLKLPAQRRQRCLSKRIGGLEALSIAALQEKSSYPIIDKNSPRPTAITPRSLFGYDGTGPPPLYTVGSIWEKEAEVEKNRGAKSVCILKNENFEGKVFYLRQNLDNTEWYKVHIEDVLSTRKGVAHKVQARLIHEFLSNNGGPPISLIVPFTEDYIIASDNASFQWKETGAGVFERMTPIKGNRNRSKSWGKGITKPVKRKAHGPLSNETKRLR